MSDPGKSNISLDTGFHFHEVDPKSSNAVSAETRKLLSLHPGLAALVARTITLPAAAAAPAAQTNVISEPLGDLTGFVNPVDPTQGLVFAGTGFNTIFRPQSPKTPTQLPVPVPASDNVLELNLTTETLSFAAPLGSVPNRGSGTQGDIFLNAVPYVQSINDVTTLPAQGIHFEPGMWLAVPPTTQPAEPATIYTRMASIPHGVTINAQGISLGRKAGKPPFSTITVNINPFPIGKAQNPPSTPFFPSQTATNQNTPRIPQDLTPFINAGTITQAMLDDPNVVLANEIASQNMQSFVTLIITTDAAGTLPTPPPNPTTPPAPPAPKPPGFGGGTDEIAFLLGDNNTPPQKPNANAFKMTAVFWIETVLQSIVVPPCTANGLPITIQAAPTPGSSLRPTFTLTPPHDILQDTTITVPYIQIQYSQTVFLNFNGLTWPHVSVATLIPAAPIVVPASVWP
jgi:hypothetical protein